jgi:hypothetical protein
MLLLLDSLLSLHLLVSTIRSDTVEWPSRPPDLNPTGYRLFPMGTLSYLSLSQVINFSKPITENYKI